MELAAEHEAMSRWLAEQREDAPVGLETAGGLLLRVLGNAVVGRPSVVEMGYRVWIMASRYAPAICPRSGRADMLEMRRLAAVCNGFLNLGDTDTERSMAVFEFVLGRCHAARCMGKRASILAYGVCTTAEVRAALPSMESIGELWGLRARNKRSAVSAAAAKMLGEAQEKTRRRGLHLQGVEMWYSKRAQTRDKYRKAQMGNHNRSASAEEDEGGEEMQAVAREMRQGIPVKAEYAGLRAEVLRARMQQMHEEAEMRRLAAL